MQIRLTVVDPLGPSSEPRGRATACDVLVTAPAGTALAAVASGLAAAVGGSGGTSQGERGREPGGGQIVLYAGAERLDAQRCTLGEPPLTDGAVLCLGAPAEPGPDLDDVSAQLHVVAGPDAGGVHLLHGGQIRIGRSADADVPLDDPDVSRLHCAVTVTPEGRVSVADIGSTNGTTLDGSRVGGRPVLFTEGALLRVGESALRLAPPGGPAVLETAPDGEGHVRVRAGSAEAGPAGDGGFDGHGDPGRAGTAARPDTAAATTDGSPAEVSRGGSSATGPNASSSSPPSSPPGPPQPRGAVPHARGESASLARGGALPPVGETHHAYGTAEWGASGGGVPGALEHGRAVPPAVPEQGGAPRIESRPRGAAAEGRDSGPGASTRGAGRPGGPGETSGGRPGTEAAAAGSFGPGAGDASGTLGVGIPGARKGTPTRGTDIPPGVRRRGGIGAWARRLAGGRGGPAGTTQEMHEDAAVAVEEVLPAVRRSPDSWPDPATLLLTALGPGPRLWERGPGHPEALTVRLGTADRTAPDGSGLLPAVPVTAGLREAGSLGLAGPRARLAGLARAVVAQLAALHSPDTLEIVLISTDRARTVEERSAEWSWLGWLPHLRPAHGQDCRLLLAYDREQAAARTDELLRRLEDHLAEAEGTPGRGPLPRSAGATVPAARSGTHDNGERVAPVGDDGLRGVVRRPSWAREDGTDDGYDGPFTVVVVDGDPGGADVREAVMRLAHEGSRAGIHLVCLAETPAASPASPVTETYEAACEASPAFRECGAVALLSGDVATALRLMRVAPGGSGERTPRGAPHTGSLQTGSPHGGLDSAGPARTGSPRSGPAHTAPAHSGPRHDGSTHTGIPHPAVARRTGPGGGAGPADATAPRTGRTSSATAGQLPRGPVGHGTVAAVDAVSLPWAERFARSLAPLRTDGALGDRHTRVSAPLPQMARLLDELGLARATPASLMARWADAADDSEAFGGRARAVLGAGPRGPVAVDLPVEGPHLLIEGPPGSGRTELLRSVAASLAAAERPDRLGIVLMDGRDGTGGHGAANGGEGLQACTDLPHVTTHLTANDPVRMREFAQSLSAELKRRSELLGRLGFAEWHAGRTVPGRIVAQRSAGPSSNATSSLGASDLDSPPSSTLRLRPAAARQRTEPGPPLARLIVVVDDLDALLSPPLGSPGRPAAGSVVRALEAVAREGDRLGVHLVAASGVGGRTAASELARSAALRVTLDAPLPGPEEPAPGRGRLLRPDGRETPFQGGRVTGRIPRTATLRPTVVPLEWHRMGDPPARRPVRELGNGPTDLALLASALERAARSVSAVEVPSLL
ncbi:FHA domain-containing protein [Streptomyces rhizosphaerihabitans]|uniref:FHA domain-containing protein n=1 Tax=Streptomyces rhizosphaerihabitans TaxID=1266770 RepID=UPI0021C209F3|nr:FHA domain-containing protein [Streptomyces rhizosphaerihabitans]MCT9011169.1 FHA domain-containing protein [Streptomyces rhizosphaerihabitans]